MGLREFALPDLGEGLDEAEIVAWHVGKGDRVVADQPLVSVETDKAVVEVPAPWSGTVSELLVAPGTVCAIGTPLARFDTGARHDAGAIVGELESGENLAAPEPGATAAARRPGATAASQRPDHHAPAGAAAPGAGPRAMPAARALAADLGIDLAEVEGTGPGGIVTRAGVVRLRDTATGARAEAAEGWTPLGGARRAMARTMATAAGVVPATLQDVADVTAWISPTADVLVRLVRASAAGIAASPRLNAWFDPGTLAVRLHERLRLGIAVDTDEGLYVPVISPDDPADAAAVRAGLDRLIAAVRTRSLAPADRADPTFTLSSYGSLGGRHASLVVTPPQVAILGAGSAYGTVAWTEAGPEPRTHLPLSLSFDHRAATGGDAARFMAAAVSDLSEPA